MINYETVIYPIASTRTRTGLKVKAVLDTNEYETGIKVSDERLDEIRLRRHKVHPTWELHDLASPDHLILQQLSTLFINGPPG